MQCPYIMYIDHLMRFDLVWCTFYSTYIQHIVYISWILSIRCGSTWFDVYFTVPTFNTWSTYHVYWSSDLVRSGSVYIIHYLHSICSIYIMYIDYPMRFKAIRYKLYNIYYGIHSLYVLIKYYRISHHAIYNELWKHTFVNYQFIHTSIPYADLWSSKKLYTHKYLTLGLVNWDCKPFPVCFWTQFHSMVLIHSKSPYSFDCHAYICTFLITQWTYRLIMPYITIFVPSESIFTITYPSKLLRNESLVVLARMLCLCFIYYRHVHFFHNFFSVDMKVVKHTFDMPKKAKAIKTETE